MQKFYMCLLSCALLTGVTGYSAEDTEKPQKPAGKPSREFRPGGEFRPGQGMPGGFRAFRIDYGYNEAEQKLVSAEENKIRQAVLQYRKEKNDANLKLVEDQVAASWKVILPIRQSAAARMEEGRNKQMTMRMLEMQQDAPERTLKMMLQQALYPPKPMAPQMPLTEEQQMQIRELDQKVRQAASAYHSEKNDANLAALKKQIVESFDQTLKIRTDALKTMPDGAEKKSAQDFVEKAQKERDLQIEDEYERLQNNFRQRIMRRGADGGFRGGRPEWGGEGGPRGGFRGGRGAGNPPAER